MSSGIPLPRTSNCQVLPKEYSNWPNWWSLLPSYRIRSPLLEMKPYHSPSWKTPPWKVPPFSQEIVCKPCTFLRFCCFSTEQRQSLSFQWISCCAVWLYGIPWLLAVRIPFYQSCNTYISDSINSYSTYKMSPWSMILEENL